MIGPKTPGLSPFPAGILLFPLLGAQTSCYTSPQSNLGHSLFTRTLSRSSSSHHQVCKSLDTCRPRKHSGNPTYPHILLLLTLGKYRRLHCRHFVSSPIFHTHPIPESTDYDSSGAFLLVPSSPVSMSPTSWHWSRQKLGHSVMCSSGPPLSPFSSLKESTHLKWGGKPCVLPSPILPLSETKP